MSWPSSDLQHKRIRTIEHSPTNIPGGSNEHTYAEAILSSPIELASDEMW